MVDIHTLMGELAQKEQALQIQTFLALCLPKGKVRTRFVNNGAQASYTITLRNLAVTDAGFVEEAIPDNLKALRDKLIEMIGEKL